MVPLPPTKISPEVNSLLNFGATDVAAKTGTTNDYRDAWIVGYTPNLSVVAWAGNNDNRSMAHKTSGLIVSPMWAEFMRFAIPKYPAGSFNDPSPTPENTKAIIKGDWNSTSVHSILHWVNRDNPLGEEPRNPNSDSQYSLWERSVAAWVNNQGFENIINTENNRAEITLLDPKEGRTYVNTFEIFVVPAISRGEITSGKVYLNDEFIGSLNNAGIFVFKPSQFDSSIIGLNRLKLVAVDPVGETYEKTVEFTLSN